MENTIEPSTKSASSVKAVYILYLVSILFPVAGLVGIVLAYLEQDKAPEWLRTHFRYQIRTFWIGLLYFVIGFALLIIIVGWFILLFNVIWLIIRMIKGLQAIDAKEPIENPTSWMF